MAPLLSITTDIIVIVIIVIVVIVNVIIVIVVIVIVIIVIVVIVIVYLSRDSGRTTVLMTVDNQGVMGKSEIRSHSVSHSGNKM